MRKKKPAPTFKQYETLDLVLSTPKSATQDQTLDGSADNVTIRKPFRWTLGEDKNMQVTTNLSLKQKGTTGEGHCNMDCTATLKIGEDLDTPIQDGQGATLFEIQLASKQTSAEPQRVRHDDTGCLNLVRPTIPALAPSLEGVYTSSA